MELSIFQVLCIMAGMIAAGFGIGYRYMHWLNEKSQEEMRDRIRDLESQVRRMDEELHGSQADRVHDLLVELAEDTEPDEGEPEPDPQDAWEGPLYG